MEKKFHFWRRFLLVTSALFAVQAISWMIIGSFDPFGSYEYWLSRWLFQTNELTIEARRTFAFVMIPFGATTAAYFALVYLIVKHAFSKREKWAYKAVVVTFLIWFLLDTVFCIFIKAYFNILIVNIPCLILMAVPLIALKHFFQTDNQHKNNS